MNIDSETSADLYINLRFLLPSRSICPSHTGRGQIVSTVFIYAYNLRDKARMWIYLSISRGINSGKTICPRPMLDWLIYFFGPCK